MLHLSHFYKSVVFLRSLSKITAETYLNFWERRVFVNFSPTKEWNVVCIWLWYESKTNTKLFIQKKKKIMYVLNGSKNLRNSSHGSRTNQEKKHLCEGKILSRSRRRIFPWQQEKSCSYIRTYFIKYHISRIISSSYNTSLHNTSNRQHLFFMKYYYARVKIKSTLVLAYLWWTMSKCLHEYHLPNFAKYVWISR